MKLGAYTRLISVLTILGWGFIACNKSDLYQKGQGYLNLKNVLDTPRIMNNSFNRSVGNPISGKQGLSWMNNYADKHKGRLDYFILTRDLQEIMRNANCTGVCLFFARNEFEENLVLPIGINAKGEMMKALMVPTEDGGIDWETALEWINHYKGGIKARFFGSHSFERLSENADCRVIRASYATDEHGQIQILLADAAQSAPFNFEGESLPCPPYCPISN